MMSQAKVSDTVISEKAREKLASLGVRAPCRVAVISSRGKVTLSGAIQYEHQRHSALRAIKAVQGVIGVVDQMKLLANGQCWKTNIKR
jgi:osmotically-inducible protein OsmY